MFQELFKTQSEVLIMDLWMDLLFGNPVGLMSMLVVFGTIIVAIVKVEIPAYSSVTLRCVVLLPKFAMS